MKSSFFNSVMSAVFSEIASGAILRKNLVQWKRVGTAGKGRRRDWYGGRETCILYITINSATILVPYSGKLLREKTFANFTVLWLFVKVFSVKFGGMASVGTAKGSNLPKFSPRKSYFSPICDSFRPQKFPAIW